MSSLKQNLAQNDLLTYERNAFARGFKSIAGLDEAGRGPLAGPVYAVACLIEEGVEFPGINDSKLLTEKRREYFYERLTAHPQVKYGVGIVDNRHIDRINIYQATKLAMRRALNALKVLPDYILIDAIKLVYKKIPVVSIIQGDRKSQTIAAASIIAKVLRDRKMCEYHKKWPQYGFDHHKGYGTDEHLKALLEHGSCPIHRSSYKPVYDLDFSENLR